MLSNYYKKKVLTQKFIDDLKWSLGEIANKKVLIYGAGESFLYLYDKFQLNNLNIVAIADLKFKTDCEETFKGIRAINPEDIHYEDFDVILVTNEYFKPILRYLFNDLAICGKDIRTVFNDDIDDEHENFIYLESFNFEKKLLKLSKKLKGKSVLLYGAGKFLEVINKYYDLSQISIIGICDKRFECDNCEDTFLGYKTYTPDEIKNLNPDYVVVSTKYYINLIDFLANKLLKGTKIKIKPLLNKSFFKLLSEVWAQ